MDLNGSAFVIGGILKHPSPRFHWPQTCVLTFLEASGIGKACALAFARYGARGIVVADIDLGAAKCLAAECMNAAANGDIQVEAAEIDVTLEDSVSNATSFASRTLGRIDYCVNSAGVSVQSSYLPTSALQRVELSF